jgi:multidrug efflux system outer membrane protein
MMNKQRYGLKLIPVLIIALMMQACSIPLLTTKKADTTLPEHFDRQANQEPSPQNQTQESAADTNWKSFFDDPQLLALIEIAVANNKEINILMQRISMAANEVEARKGEYKPFVSFGAGIESGKVGKYTRNGAVEEQLEIKEGKAFPEPLGNYQFGLFSSWELDVWKKLRNATKVANMEYLASIEGKNFLVTNLVAEVAKTYYELMAVDNQLENLHQNIKIQQNALEVSRELQQYARATSLAVKRFEAEVQKNQSREYGLRQQQTELENRINFLLGRTPQPIQRSSAGLMNLQTKMVQAGVPSQLLQHRPDIRKAELELAAADLNIQVAKANFYPSFSIKAGLGFQAFNPKYLLSTPESLMYSLAGDVMAPLVNRNAITAVYKNANAAQVQAAFEYEQTIINAYVEVANQLANIDNLGKNYQLKSQQVGVLTESVEVANQLFKSARAEYLEILLTQREALEAKSELIETKQQQMSAIVNLYRALGGGWQ